MPPPERGLRPQVSDIQPTAAKTQYMALFGTRQIVLDQYMFETISIQFVRGFDTRNEGNNGSACVKRIARIARMETSCIQSLKQNFH